jgi:DNA helicase-2/ATP-dependent DNA helicase PcrA
MQVQTEIRPAIRKAYPSLNRGQVDAVAATQGPVLLIAGPGSGKTLALAIRAVNILTQGLANPREVLVCTFTEKAAFELRDRISAVARNVGYEGDLSELRASTIHSMCDQLVMTQRHHTPLGSNYQVLDELTQLLFIFDNFNDIIGEAVEGKYLGRWTTRWGAIEGVRSYFNKIAEELVDPSQLVASSDPFVSAVGSAYRAYEATLYRRNCIDFAHLQKLCHQLLESGDLKSPFKYVLVDEYQDTNYIQEQLLLKLASPDNNICVVGDEDQSLYRFRGSTVRNILEFDQHFPNCQFFRLTTNYRSHKAIIAAYNKFMAGCDWTDRNGRLAYRHDKEILPDPEGTFPEYPAVFCIWGQSKKDEAQRFAELVKFLRDNRVIEDYSQVALLLHSVRAEHSAPYIAALQEKGIPSFCPRARNYFENEEVRYMVGCFAVLLGYYGDGRGELQGNALQEMASYVDDCIVDLAKNFAHPHPLAKSLRRFEDEIHGLRPGETLDRRLGDYFYQLLAHEPFVTMAKNENRARNLAILSQLLSTFQNYYRYTVISHANRGALRLHFFNSFLRLLYLGGINEYEDPDHPLPKGYVQIMTIHQAKGLEFPVVVVGSLDKQLSSPKDIDRNLAGFYHRPPFETEGRITEFDRMRLYYVAFSRAERILVLTSTERPKEHFYPIWQGLPQWPYVQQDLLKALFFRLKNRMPLKKTFSFTGDVKVFETCPRQYQFFRDYEFLPARSAEIFFGSLVHQTIEDIHRAVLDGRPSELTEDWIWQRFDFNFRSLVSLGLRPIGEVQRKEALTQVLNYFHQNRADMDRIIETEVDVSLEKEDYILTGKIDLLLAQDGALEVLDFKSQTRPQEDDARLQAYYKQLCIYAHVLERRYGKRAQRLLLYWTGEPRREDALMEFPYRPDMVDEAGRYFDKVVSQILTKDYVIRKPPERKVCKECDLRLYCGHEGVINIRDIEGA